MLGWMMRGGLTAVMLMAVAAFSQPVFSQERYIYTCRDPDSGRILTSDRPPIECFNRTEIRQFDRQGVVVRVIEPQLTSEQRREKQLAEDKARAEAAAQVEQRRRDRTFLALYPNVDAIEQARKRGLAVVETTIRVSKDRIVTLEKEREALAQEEEYYPNRPLPGNLKRKIDEVEGAIVREKRALAERDAELLRINQRFDEEVKRYQTLTSADNRR